MERGGILLEESLSSGIFHRCEYPILCIPNVLTRHIAPQYKSPLSLKSIQSLPDMADYPLSRPDWYTILYPEFPESDP